METSVPGYYNDYQHPYSRGLYFHQPASSSYSMRNYLQNKPALMNCYSPARSLVMYRPPTTTPYSTLPPCQQYHVSTDQYRSRDWRRPAAAAAASAIHPITFMTPPTVSRCVSTLSSPLAVDQQTRSGTSDTGGTAVGAQSDITCAQSYYLGSNMPSRFLRWMNDGLMEHSYETVPAFHTDHICRSLVDTSLKPSALNDAICMYIDYLTRDNNRVIGELSVVAGDVNADSAAVITPLVNDDLYHDMFCQPSSFPTSRFREWLQIYSVDLEITDPEGRRLTQATFPGCSCQSHQVVRRQLSESTATRAAHQVRTASRRSSWNATRTQSSYPRRGMLLSPVGSRVSPAQRGRSRGRARGRGRRAGRTRRSSKFSDTEHGSVGNGVSGRRAENSRSNVLDRDCNDDSAVVEFLASLQSDAVQRRRRLLLELESAANSVNTEVQGKVVEEVVNDDVHLCHLRPVNCQSETQVLAAGSVDVMSEPQALPHTSLPSSPADRRPALLLNIDPVHSSDANSDVSKLSE